MALDNWYRKDDYVDIEAREEEESQISAVNMGRGKRRQSGSHAQQ